MASDKLRKYLAYYQKVLKEDPENIEARLRLAAIFREMGRTSHAVDEYVTASKLLAKDGLPLEAIAACKAVLELEPSHSEIQYFLARLFAQVPEAAGNAARIAQPLGDAAEANLRKTARASAVAQPIELTRPKSGAHRDASDTRNVDVLAEVWEPSKGATRPGRAFADVPELHDFQLIEDDEDSEVTVDQAEELDALDDTAPRPAPALSRLDEALTVEADAIDPSERPGSRRPSALTATQDVDASDILASMQGDAEGVESFEVGVFDMESLRLDEGSDGFEPDFLVGLDTPGSSELDDSPSGITTGPAVLHVNRADLPEIPLFSQLKPQAFMELLRIIDLQRLPAGTAVTEPGRGPNTLYVVVRGSARVTRIVDDHEVELATMGEGDFFGEFRLLTGRDGAATVRAKSDLELLAIGEDVLNRVADGNPEIWDVLWDFYYARMLNNLLAASEMFRPLAPEERVALGERFAMREVVGGELLLARGARCEHLYLVLAGEVCVERDLGGITEELATMREGEFFGVASSLSEEPYPADVRARRDTMLLGLPAADFQRLHDGNQRVASAVQKVIRSRRALNSAFASGITPYGELGIAQELD